MKRDRSTSALRGLAITALAVLFFAGNALAAGPKKTILYSFTGGNDGALPFDGVTFDSTGAAFVTTDAAGPFCSGGGQCGSVDKLTQTAGKWTETTLYDFGEQSNDGYSPDTGVLLDKSGNVYGTTTASDGAIYQLVLQSGVWTANWLYGSPHDYLMPTPVLDDAGNLYDTDTSANNGNGTVFQLTNSNGTWTTNVIHNFNGSDGYAPGALIIDKVGGLYGVTAGGGDTKCNPPLGCGAIFRLTPPAKKDGAWTFKNLFLFHGGTSGANTFVALTRDANGNLYGTAPYSGNKTCPKGVECEVAFEISPPSQMDGYWKQTIIHNFLGNTDGAWVSAALTLDSKGALYGTSRAGGNGPCLAGNNPIGCGTVYKLTPPTESGGRWTETVLYRFQGGSDGALPNGSVALDATGALYSTTVLGGREGYGTFFKLVP
jgi:hypothetical protein